MRILLFILVFFISISGNSQLTSLVVRGDTLFNIDPSTGISTQLTKLVPSQVGQSGNVLSTNGTNYTWINNSASVAWGGITGTLSDQTDLQTALNNKLATNGNGSSLTGITQSQITNLTSDLALKANITSQNFVTPNIGVSSGTSLATTGAITSSGGGIGYAAGAGGTVTQATNKTTGVTLNKLSGQITMNNAALAAAAEVAFTLTNSFIASTDVVIVNVQSVGTAGSYFVTVGAVANGSCSITVGNVSAGSLSQALVLNFTVIKSVNN